MQRALEGSRPTDDEETVLTDIWMPWRLQKALFWEHARRNPRKFPNIDAEDGWREGMTYDDVGETLTAILESYFAEHPEQGRPFTRP